MSGTAAEQKGHCTIARCYGTHSRHGGSGADQVSCAGLLDDTMMPAYAQDATTALGHTVQSSTSRTADGAAAKAGKAERDVVSIAVAAGVRPSADAVETAQSHELETQGPRVTASAAAQRDAMPAADQPPLRFQRRA